MDFLAIGDVVIDAFIKLKDARVHCNINDEDCEICMRWGDKIPFESATVIPAVGNSANAAVSASRLGLKAALRAYVGKDEYGQQCIEALQHDGVMTDLIEQQDGKHTNYHYVLWYEDNRTILVKHETFDYTVPRLDEGPKWIYLTSLSDNSLPYHQAWIEKLSHWPNTKLAFQPGTFQLKMGREQLANLYKRTDVFFCNKEEAERLLGMPAGTTMKVLLQKVQELGPKIAIITDDARGAMAIDETHQIFHCPRYPDTRKPFEITGAGDAFASTTVAALSLGKSLPDALMWGAVNASAVLQEIGAQKGLLTREQLEKNLANPPSAFSVSKL
ncbi:carbohydrate kinase family protein [Candidatus Parcubacteria bacterium]|nr:carbohydrate kinase family protein [Candidatus Parcubacteria bacterium]